MTLTATDQFGNSDTETLNVVANPVQTYAPLVFLHPKEKYFPGSPDEYIAHSQLKFQFGKNPNVKGAKNCGAASESPKPADPVALGAGDYLAHEVDWSQGKCTQLLNDVVTSNAWSAINHDNKIDPFIPKWEGFYLDNGPKRSKPDPQTEYGDPSLQSGLYYQYVPGSYIAYWFFYPYNYWNSYGWPSRADEAQAGRPEAA